ncbi:hypothetical protein, partial [Streptomyces boluensis]|uniref:hypothetical protein n=1 Tax=Streptomyces boluensis TaxID=1775135 RepID=UPI001CB7184A
MCPTAAEPGRDGLVPGCRAGQVGRAEAEGGVGVAVEVAGEGAGGRVQEVGPERVPGGGQGGVPGDVYGTALRLAEPYRQGVGARALHRLDVHLRGGLHREQRARGGG